MSWRGTVLGAEERRKIISLIEVFLFLWGVFASGVNLAYALNFNSVNSSASDAGELSGQGDEGNETIENSGTAPNKTANQTTPANEAPETENATTVTFDRRLAGEGVGQHRAPPSSLIEMTVTATVSSPVEKGVLTDYFPVDWSMSDAKGGVVGPYDADYNKIEWDIGSIVDSASRSYTITSPPLTAPITEYRFQSELGDKGSSEWIVMVADDSGATTPPTVAIHSPQSIVYTEASIDLNVSADGTVDVWIYDLNGAGNVTFTPNTTITGISGANEITVWAKNLLGNWGVAVQYFAVGNMTIPPPTQPPKEKAEPEEAPASPPVQKAQVDAMVQDITEFMELDDGAVINLRISMSQSEAFTVLKSQGELTVMDGLSDDSDITIWIGRDVFEKALGSTDPMAILVQESKNGGVSVTEDKNVITLARKGYLALYNKFREEPTIPVNATQSVNLIISLSELVQGQILPEEPVSWTQELSVYNPTNQTITSYAINLASQEYNNSLPLDAFNIKINNASADFVFTGDAIEQEQTQTYPITFQTVPIQIEIQEIEIPISLLDILPKEAFGIEPEEQIQLEEIKGKRIKKEVVIEHNSSLHYKNFTVKVEVNTSLVKVRENKTGETEELDYYEESFIENETKKVNLLVDRLSLKKFTLEETVEGFSILNISQGKAEIDTPVNWTMLVNVTNQPQPMVAKIKYKTPAPYKNESPPSIQDSRWSINVTISSGNISTHYQNISAYMDLPELSDFILYHYELVNGTRIPVNIMEDPLYNVTLLDQNSDSRIDRVEWNVPQLSEDDYTGNGTITILNVQSYPTVGGNWTVMFNTTGTANLTITPINGTSFDIDLEFLELRCGGSKVEPVYNGTSVFYEDWNCSDTGEIINGVITSGKHTLEFSFGTAVAYAYNLATYPFSVRVSQSSDDAEETVSTGATAFSGSVDLELVYDAGTEQEVGMRFQNVDIPQGANITGAYIEFEADNSDSGVTNLNFFAEDIDDAATFGANDYNITNRNKTSASAQWNNVPAWTVDVKYQTSDLSAIIQEVIDRPGWTANNALVVIVNGTGEREAEAYDGESANAPLLVVNFSLQASFTDYSATSGANNGGSAYAIAWADYDNDGYLDLWIGGDGLLYNNDGDGTFTSTTEAPTGGRAGAWADYDNDGYMDLFATSNGYFYDNDGDGTFTERASAAGLAGSNLGTACWLDYDDDGDQDLFFPNGNSPYNQIRRNDGDGGFTAIDGSTIGLTPEGNGETCAVADWNNDGSTDIFYYYSTGQFFVSDGDGTFTQNASGMGITLSSSDPYMALVFGDYDNDGDLDFFAGQPSGVANKLYRNDGNGSFTDVSSAAGVGVNLGNSRGAAWGDYDNDGDLDLLVGNDGANNYLYRNNGSGIFTNIAGTLGINGSSGATKSVSFADYDNDGDLDIYYADGGQANDLWRNDLNNTNYLKVKVTGRGTGHSSKDGIGTQIRVYNSTGDLVGMREVSGGEGYGSQGPQIQHFGLNGSLTYTVEATFLNGTKVNKTNVVPVNEQLNIGGTTLNNTIEILEDQPPYQVDIQFPANNTWNTSLSMNIGALVSDDSGFTNLTLHNASSGAVLAYNSSAVGNGSVNVLSYTFPVDGVHVVYVNATDNATTLQSNQSVNWTIKIDATAPAIDDASHSINDTAVGGGEYVNLSVTVTDNLGVDSVVFNVSGTNYTATGPGGTGGVYWAEVQFPSSGTYWWNQTWVNDTGGYTDINASVELSWVVDAIAPTVTLASPQNDTYTATSIDLNVSADETIDTWWYEYNGNGTNITIGTGGTSINTTLFASGGDSAKNITVYANDTVGNESFSVVYFTLDVMAPTIDDASHSINETTVIGGEYVNLSVTVTDAIGVDTVVFNVSGTNYTASGGGVTGGTYWVEVQFPTAGTYWWNQTWVNDTSGKTDINAAVGLSWIVDTSTPTVTITSPTNDSYATTSISLSASADETIHTWWYEYNGDGTNITIGTGGTGITTTLSAGGGDGAKNVTVYANDSGGNLDSATQYFTVDTTAPTIDDASHSINDTAVSGGEYVNLSVTMTDALALDTVVLNVSGTNYTATGPGGTAGVYWVEVQFPTTGTYWWNQTWVNDTAGNTDINASVELSWIVDAIVPTITLNSPANDSSSIESSRVLNATVTDDFSDSMTMYFYGSNDTSNFDTSLLYVRNGTANDTALTYNWGAPVLQPDSNTTLLMHFDNRSAYGENDTYVYDFSGNENNGSCSGANCPAFNLTGGKFAGAFEYDGVDDYIEVPNSASLNIAVNQITIEAWIKPSGATYRQIVGRAAGIGGAQRQYGLYVSDGNKLGFETRTTDGLESSEKGSITNDVWSHVAGVYNGSNMILYINGVSVGSDAQTGTITPQTSNVYVGQFPTGTDRFNGAIDEVAIYNRSLSASEILDHYRLKVDTYYWRVNASDDANTGTSDTWQFTVIEDTTPPTVADASHSINDTAVGGGEYVNLSVTVTDNIEVDTVVFNVSGTNYTASGGGVTGGTYWVEIQYPTSGTYWWNQTWVNDTSGNTDINASVELSWVVDATAPTIDNASHSINDTAVGGGEYVNLSVTVTDGNGVGSVVFNVSGTNYTATGPGGTGGVYWAEVQFPSSGTYWWNQTWVNDTVGNASINASVELSWVVDAIAPTVTIASPTNDSYATTTIDLNVSADETIDTWWYEYNGNGTNITIGTGGTSINTTLFASGGDSAKNITVYANDTVGNESSSVVYFTLDTILPTITWESPTPSNATATSNNWVYLNTTITDASNTSAFFDWNNSLVGYWAMDWYNSTGIFDNSTYANFGTFQGGLGTGNITTGKYGKALDFDGSDDYINIGDIGTLSNDTFSVSVWVKVPDPSPRQAMVWGAVAGLDERLRLEVYSSGISFYDDYSMEVLAGSTITADTWYYVVATYDYPNQQAYVYVDGEFKASDTSFSQASSTLGRLDIGAKDDGEYYLIDGILDEVRIHNRVLSPEEINASYDNGLYRLYHNFTSLSNGTYDYYAYAIDAAGNANKSEVRTITVDTTLPSIDDASHNINETIVGGGEYVNLSVTVTDNLGVDTVVFNVSGTNYTATGPGGTGGVYWVEVQFPTSGTYWWNQTWVNDTAGNSDINASVELSWVVDATAPTISIISPTNTTYASGPVITITYGATETIAEDDYYQLDGGSNTTFTNGTTTITPATGSHNIRVWAKDSSGNWGTAIQYFTVSAPPAAAAAAPAPASVGGGARGARAQDLPTVVETEVVSVLDQKLIKEILEKRELGDDVFTSAPIGLSVSLVSVGKYPVPSDPWIVASLSGPIESAGKRPERFKDQDVVTPASIEELHEIAAAEVLEKYHRSSTVIIAKRDPAVDGIAAIAYARANNWPILLTEQDALPGATLNAVKKLGANKIYLVGGQKAISLDVEGELGSVARVERISGPTRVETSVKLAAKIERPKFIAITDGRNPDINTLIIAAEYGAPVVYTMGEEIPEAVKAYLLDNREFPRGIAKNWVLAGVDPRAAAKIDALYELPEFLTTERLSLSGYRMGATLAR